MDLNLIKSLQYHPMKSYPRLTIPYINPHHFIILFIKFYRNLLSFHHSS